MFTYFVIKMKIFYCYVVVLQILIWTPSSWCQQFPRRYNNYIERQLLCALDRGPCDVLGGQIKEALPEVIGNNCATCNQFRVANAKRIAGFVQNQYPDAWVALVKKYGSNKISN